VPSLIDKFPLERPTSNFHLLFHTLAIRHVALTVIGRTPHHFHTRPASHSHHSFSPTPPCVSLSVDLSFILHLARHHGNTANEQRFSVRLQGPLTRRTMFYSHESKTSSLCSDGAMILTLFQVLTNQKYGVATVWYVCLFSLEALSRFSRLIKLLGWFRPSGSRPQTARSHEEPSKRLMFAERAEPS